jgi:thiamine-phosphate pyrophosphorylase
MIVVQITACDVLGVDELLQRIDGSAANGGPIFVVQLRDPQLSGRDLFELGTQLRGRTRAVGARLIVNDRVDLAIALGADGVHLGRTSISIAEARGALETAVGAAWVSCSAHSVEDAAAASGADAVLLSPVYASPGKDAPLGVDVLSQARRVLPDEVKLLALGGVDCARAAVCLNAGADGVASIRADLTPLLR